MSIVDIGISGVGGTAANPLYTVAGTGAVVGAGTAATAARTVTASDSPDVTSLGVMDDWDESDRAKVNVIVGQAGIAAGAGAVGATVPRVTMASDSPDVSSLATIATLLAALTPDTQGTDTTATAGTPEQINAGTSRACRLVVVSNWSSSNIAVGFSNAVDVALKTGVVIAPNASYPFPCTNTNQIWVDVTTNADAYGWASWT